MLARSNRLTNGRGFAAAIRRGRRAGRSTVVLHLEVPAVQTAAEPAAGEELPRVGLVVGRAVGNAVARNQVKRRLRHLVRERLGSLPGGAVLVVRALPPAATASSAAMGRDVDAALTRLLGIGRA
jgi:ribonuclease P protein component